MVQPGGHLSAWITTTAGYCGSKGPVMVNAITKEAKIIPETVNKPMIRVYPNPTDDKFTLELNPIDKDLPVNVTIYNMNGKIILRQLFNGKTIHQFSLADQPAGMYIVHVNTVATSAICKILKSW